MFYTTKTKNRIIIAARTLSYAMVLWILTLWLFPKLIISAEDAFGIARFTFPFQLTTAIAIFAVSAGLNLHSAITMVMIGKGTPLPMDCAPTLVVRGLYRFVRNPMAIGGLGMGLAIGIGSGSTLVIGYVLAGMMFWNFVVRPIEERDLASRFGTPYLQYQQQVMCWIPTMKYRQTNESQLQD